MVFTDARNSSTGYHTHAVFIIIDGKAIQRIPEYGPQHEEYV